MMTHKIGSGDGVELALHEYHAKNGDPDHALLVMPGFAQHGTTDTFRAVCEGLTETLEDNPGVNVFCIDPRGTGASQGRYGFGHAEHFDVAAALDHLRENFKRVDVLGFSLGAYSALRAVGELNAQADRLFLVSCPTGVQDIIWNGHAFRHSLSAVLNGTAFTQERTKGFRYNTPFQKMPTALEFAPQVHGSVYFLSGTADLLVPMKMSHRVFVAVGGHDKHWDEIRSGAHAELMCFSNPRQFRRWLNPESLERIPVKPESAPRDLD